MKQLLEIVEAFCIVTEKLECHPHGVAFMQLAQIARVDFGGEGRMLVIFQIIGADTEEFAKILRDAKGVWFDGGRQWNIVDSYAKTLTEREFHNVLERGGVIGGSSAGATIQGDYLVRGAIAGSDIVMTPEPEHEHGFAFLRKVAIDQHINTRNRWDDIIPVIKKYPNLLGIGLSEGTAIVVTGAGFR